MKDGALLSKIAAAMKKNKRVEICVYAALALVGVLLFLSTVDFSGWGGEDAALNMSDTERRLAETLSCIDGAGDVEVMLILDEDSTPRGVIVIAEGASDVTVRVLLKRAVQTVLDVDAESVEVFQMREQQQE